ncbi:unnamed protein product [Phytomonas sp. Hart1]|nr:unnamed protein product [Phytomonas sp. Hart1]|eukprot:CCW69485.1 unnamed protein product [Phytomonas sp. isolate Hart1]
MNSKDKSPKRQTTKAPIGTVSISGRPLAVLKWGAWGPPSVLRFHPPLLRPQVLPRRQSTHPETAAAFSCPIHSSRRIRCALKGGSTTQRGRRVDLLGDLFENGPKSLPPPPRHANRRRVRGEKQGTPRPRRGILKKGFSCLAKDQASSSGMAADNLADNPIDPPPSQRKNRVGGESFVEICRSWSISNVSEETCEPIEVISSISPTDFVFSRDLISDDMGGSVISAEIGGSLPVDERSEAGTPPLDSLPENAVNEYHRQISNARIDDRTSILSFKGKTMFSAFSDHTGRPLNFLLGARIHGFPWRALPFEGNYTAAIGDLFDVLLKRDEGRPYETRTPKLSWPSTVDSNDYYEKRLVPLQYSILFSLSESIGLPLCLLASEQGLT